MSVENIISLVVGSETNNMTDSYLALKLLIPPPDFLRKCLRVNEIVFLGLSFVSNILFLKILYSRKLLHSNIRLLCCSQILASLLFAIVR